MITSLSTRAPLLPALLVLGLIVAMFSAAPPADAAVIKPLDIVKIYFDPPGKDEPKNSGYNKEFIVVKNTGTKSLTLTGYVIRDSGPQKFTFPRGTTLGAGKSLTIRSGTGKNSSSTLYWGKKSYIWNNTGDTARSYDAKGRLLETCTYKGGGTTANC